MPIDDEALFLVVTNNYRAAGGGNFPEVTADKIVIDAPDENRQVLASYIAELGTVNPSANLNWSIAPVNAMVNVVFRGSPSARAVEVANASPRLFNTEMTDEDGYLIYRLDLDPNL